MAAADWWTIELLESPAAPRITSGTPTFEGALQYDWGRAPHQISPGTVVFSDLRTLERTDVGLRPAAVVLCRDVSRPADDVVTLDVGSKSVAAECAMLKTNVRCNSIHPGVIDSDMGSLFYQQLTELGITPSMEAAEAGFLAAVPMGEPGQPSDIAAGVVYLASDASRYVTGSELVIDGGFYAT